MAEFPEELQSGPSVVINRDTTFSYRLLHLKQIRKSYLSTPRTSRKWTSTGACPGDGAVALLTKSADMLSKNRWKCLTDRAEQIRLEC